MTLRTDVLLAILAMAVLSFLCRAGGYYVLRRTRPSRFVEAMLGHLPGALFVAFLAPAVIHGGWPSWVAAVATLAAQHRFGNLALSIAAGVAAMWAAQALAGVG